ncbi:helix-turn-helix domain-containing protein [Treponema berlinense]|uniref:helix-turn-helix domain-containing protein n=1 Tax=Treponema berlinense TaxID=225004 RepID=UPI003EFC6E49
MEINMAVAQAIKEKRIENHLSQEKLADMIDSHQVYISEIEKGKKIPSIMILYNIAKSFGMTLTEFIGIIEDKINQ